MDDATVEMSIYYMPVTVHQGIWRKLEQISERKIFDYRIVDRFFRYKYKLEAISDEPDHVHGGYPFRINNEELFLVFLLKWT